MWASFLFPFCFIFGVFVSGSVFPFPFLAFTFSAFPLPFRESSWKKCEMGNWEIKKCALRRAQ